MMSNLLGNIVVHGFRLANTSVKQASMLGKAKRRVALKNQSLDIVSSASIVLLLQTSLGRKCAKAIAKRSLLPSAGPKGILTLNGQSA